MENKLNSNVKHPLHRKIKFILCRVPFFLEPGYIKQNDDFWEMHDTRMIRKFGSKSAFERVKASHGLSKSASCVDVFDVHIFMCDPSYMIIKTT